MSFTRTIRDIESVEPSELNGIATGDLPADGNSSGVQVSNVGGTILFELADGGGGVTLAIQGTAPDSPTAGALWYDNTGDDEDLTSQLYIATVVAQDGGNDVVAWVPASPAPSVPSLPAMSDAGNYQLTVGDDSSLSWTAITDSGGGGGGGSTAYATAITYGDTDGNNTLVMDSAGTWRFRVQNRGNGTRYIACSSGFSNITGGWYEFDSDTRRDPTSTTDRSWGSGEWDSNNNQFNIIRWGGDLNVGSDVVEWSQEYTGGTLANQASMSGATGTAVTAQLIRNAGWVYGELIISGPVTLTIYSSTGGTLSATSQQFVSLNRIS